MKQQQLLYDKGLTNVPSDAICSDNALSDAVGMVYDEGEHRVIQKPAHKTNLGGSGYRLLLVHQLPTNDKNYIVANGTSLYWRTETTEGSTVYYHTLNITVPADITANQISVIGKTLIIATDDGLKYAVWQGNDYKSLGSIPAPSVTFKLSDYTGSNGSGFSAFPFRARREGDWFNQPYVNPEVFNHDAYDEAMTGAYAEARKLAWQAKKFCEPFMIRYAVEMYDGSYTLISQPIAVFPCITANAQLTDVDDQTSGFSMIELAVNACTLWYKGAYDYSDYSDIVKGVAIFASKGVTPYDFTVHQAFDANGSDIVWDRVSAARSTSQISGEVKYQETRKNDHKILTKKDADTLRKELYESSQFYKLATITELYADGAMDSRIDGLIEVHTLENLTTQEWLKYDDYFSHADLRSGFLYSYNSRLNLAGIKRGLWKGYEDFVVSARNTSYNYVSFVEIKTDDGIKVVRNNYISNSFQGIYFYYPDPRASWLSLWVNIGTSANPQWRVVIDTKLKPHPGLNGAYCEYGFPEQRDNDNVIRYAFSTARYGLNSTINDSTESLPNQIATSEVNNPWVFNASGYNTIGNGRVLAMTTQTRALSEGQFGQYPLLVFCNDGIWAMSVDRTGLFQTIQPMSREVITEGSFPVQTDGAVFFASKKGLMAVVGGDVQCVSQQLSGRANGSGIGSIGFHEFLQNAFFAYDYRDSLIWIFNNSTNFNRECYVYAIRSGTFAKYVFQSPIANVCNDYPDTLLQVENNNAEILSLTGRPDINDDNDDNDSTYEAVLTTRPVKLENALALKTILQMHHVNTLSSDSILQVKIEASNNLSDATGSWVTLRSLHGAPWKYYRFTYTFSNLKPTDRFAGTVLLTDERRTSKLR